MKEIRLLTREIEELQAIKKKMLSVVMYSSAWFALKEKWQKLFQRIEKRRGPK